MPAPTNLKQEKPETDVVGTLTVAWTTQGVYRGRGLARLALPDALNMVASRCRATAETASTGTATFTMTVDGSSVGTVTFTASATGVVAFTNTAFAAGTFKLTAPSSVDATLANISITLSGDR